MYSRMKSKENFFPPFTFISFAVKSSLPLLQNGQFLKQIKMGIRWYLLRNFVRLSKERMLNRRCQLDFWINISVIGPCKSCYINHGIWILQGAIFPQIFFKQSKKIRINVMNIYESKDVMSFYSVVFICPCITYTPGWYLWCRLKY